MTILHIDFETRSAVDLKQTGVYPYATDPSTDVWCLAWAVDDEPVSLWVPGDEPPGELVCMVVDGDTVCGHNVMFEYLIWNHILVPRYGFPKLFTDQLDCTAARAAIMALPRSLDGAAKAMGLDVEKDAAGHRLMLQMSKPRKPRKHEEPDELLWWDDEDRKQRLFAYCKTDVEVERDLDRKLRPMSPHMRQLWLMDFRLNLRGVPVDVPFVERAQQVGEITIDDYNEQMARVTTHQVKRTSDAGALRVWVSNQLKRQIDSLDKAALSELLDEPELPENVRAALTLRQEAGKSSNAKWSKFLQRTTADGRMRENMMFHGASTGRWAGRGVQLQNLPSRTSLDAVEISQAIRIVRENPPERAYQTLRMVFNRPVTEILSACLRGAVCTTADNEFKVADYSNIEGRVNAWQAGEDWKLAAFRDFDAGIGPDLYKVAAAGIYGMTPEDVAKVQRQIGKVSELALGYQGGPGAYDSMAKNYAIDIGSYYDVVIPNVDQEYVARALEAWDNYGKKSGMGRDGWITAEVIKLAWRDKHPATVRSWRDMEDAAVSAVSRPGSVHEAGKVSFMVDRIGGVAFLMCRLPSGRLLYYCRPQLLDKKTPWGSVKKLLTYDSVDAVTRKWTRASIYGGKWCIAEDTPVLTDAGMVPIQHVTRQHKLWDGDNWVAHDGLDPRGDKDTVEAFAVRMTPDHEVLTTEGWKHASQSEGHNRAYCRLPDGFELSRIRREKVVLESRLFWMRGADDTGGNRAGEAEKAGRNRVVRLPTRDDGRPEADEPRTVPAPGLRGLAQYAGALRTAGLPGLAQLRRARDSGMRALENLCGFLGGHGAIIPAGSDAGPQGQRRELRAGELSLGNSDGAGEQPAKQQADSDTGREHVCGGGGASVPDRPHDAGVSDRQRLAAGTVVRPSGRAAVYDILNAGPQRRFTVFGRDGLPLIVHNCENVCQAISFDLMAGAMLEAERQDYPPVMSVHDEIISETAEGYGSLADFERIMCDLPHWAAGLPIATEGFVAERYRK